MGQLLNDYVNASAAYQRQLKLIQITDLFVETLRDGLSDYCGFDFIVFHRNAPFVQGLAPKK